MIHAAIYFVFIIYLQSWNLIRIVSGKKKSNHLSFQIWFLEHFGLISMKEKNVEKKYNNIVILNLGVIDRLRRKILAKYKLNERVFLLMKSVLYLSTPPFSTWNDKTKNAIYISKFFAPSNSWILSFSFLISTCKFFLAKNGGGKSSEA